MAILATILQVLLLLSGLFLMIVILLQRGRGGGLAGAFGGTGGQSAFGTKAGDVFTWITVVTATVWVLLAGVGGCVMRKAETSYAAGSLPKAGAKTTEGENNNDDAATDDTTETGSGLTPGGLELPAGNLESPIADPPQTSPESGKSTTPDSATDNNDSPSENTEASPADANKSQPE